MNRSLIVITIIALNALAEARNDEQVNADVILSTIEQLQDLLPKKQGTNLNFAKRKLQMLDIKDS